MLLHQAMSVNGKLLDLLSDALSDDAFGDDVTSKLLGDKGRVCVSAVVRSRQSGVFSGEAVVEALSRILSGTLEFQCEFEEGQRIEEQAIVARLAGPVGEILSTERTLLNFLSHACGVATTTRQFVDAVQPHRAKILATRKTLPGLRELQLTAVIAGGGFIHRRSLSDGILIKDNHRALVGGVELIRLAKEKRSPLHRIEIEVQDGALLDRVLPERPDVIMLDNMDLEEIANAIQKIDGCCAIEVSGGVSLSSVGAIAALGVDYISVGALTHSVRALDLTLDIGAA